MNREDILTISFKEIKDICKKRKKIITIATSVCFFLGLFYALIKPVKYMAEGVFKDKSKASNHMSSFAGLLSGSNAQDNNAIALMKSRTIRENIAKTLNFQATIRQDSDNFIKNIWNNIAAETKQFIYPYYLSLQDKPINLIIKDIVYEKEDPHSINLKFISENEFEIVDNEEKIIGKIGSKVVAKNYSFTIEKVSKTPLTNETYKVRFFAISQVTKNILDHLIIEQDKTDKNLLNIKFKDKNRHTAALTINTLMNAYKDYLKKEQNIVIDHQIQYLERRQDEIGNKLKNSMEGHVAKISDDIQEIGFPTMTLAMEYLTASQSALQKKLVDIEFELKRLQNSQRSNYVYYDTYTLPGDPTIINEMLNEMRNLKAESVSLNLSLQNFTPPADSKDFEGINLKVSQDLFVAYTHKLNEIESEMLQNKFVIDKMQQENFDLSSLGTILHDQTSREVSQKASQLVMNLKDSHNRSIKEQERIKEDLDLQKIFLSDHLENANDLLALNENLMRYKVKSLQNMTLGVIKQRLFTLETNLSDYIVSRIENLKAEVAVIEKHKLALMNQMSQLPSKWVSEKLMTLEMEVNQRMAEEVSKLVETKNISSNLEIIQSTVIDEAKAPLHPVSPRPILFALLGAIVGALFTSSYFIFQSLTPKER